MHRVILLATTFLVISSPSFAEIRYVAAGDNLQAAINAARPGDELRLAPGAKFTGNFVLPVFTGTSPVTLRSDIPDAELPPHALISRAAEQSARPASGTRRRTGRCMSTAL